MTKHNDAGAKEKMLDAFATHMARPAWGMMLGQSLKPYQGCDMIESAIRHTVTVKIKAKLWSLIV